MSGPAIPLDEFDYEMGVTRRVIERVPSERGEWKPHEKSFSLGHLTQLVASMPGWITNALREPHLDLAAMPGYSYETTEHLLQEFDRHVLEAREALQDVTGERLGEPWTLRMGDRTLFSMAKGPVVRQDLSHLCHHRGQLTVYLRMLDVPVPSIYGPTADEPWGS